jgi:hypothetical protein
LLRSRALTLLVASAHSNNIPYPCHHEWGPSASRWKWLYFPSSAALGLSLKQSAQLVPPTLQHCTQRSSKSSIPSILLDLPEIILLYAGRSSRVVPGCNLPSPGSPLGVSLRTCAGNCTAQHTLFPVHQPHEESTSASVVTCSSLHVFPLRERQQRSLLKAAEAGLCLGVGRDGQSKVIPCGC